MFVSIIRRHIPSERDAVAQDLVTTKLVPLMQEAPGFVSYTVVRIDPYHVVTVTMWESEAMWDAYRDKHNDSEALQQLAALATRPPKIIAHAEAIFSVVPEK